MRSSYIATQSEASALHSGEQTAWDNNDYVFYYKIEKI